MQRPLDRVRTGRGWPWYLRSFTRSPIEVEFPLPAQPMLVCYWARWADSAGEVSRFSETCVARIEGWTPNALPASVDAAAALPAGAGTVRVVEGDRPQLPAVEARCVIVPLPYAETMLPAARMEKPARALPGVVDGTHPRALAGDLAASTAGAEQGRLPSPEADTSTSADAA